MTNAFDLAVQRLCGVFDSAFGANAAERLRASLRGDLTMTLGWFHNDLGRAALARFHPAGAVHLPGNTAQAARLGAANRAALIVLKIHTSGEEPSEEVMRPILQLLAWEEGLALIDAVLKLCTAGVSIGGLVAGLGEKVDAYLVAVGRGDEVAQRKADEADPRPLAHAISSAMEFTALAFAGAEEASAREWLSRLFGGPSENNRRNLDALREKAPALAARTSIVLAGVSPPGMDLLDMVNAATMAEIDRLSELSQDDGPGALADVVGPDHVQGAARLLAHLIGTGVRAAKSAQRAEGGSR